MGENWVTPKLAIKKRRASSVSAASASLPERQNLFAKTQGDNSKQRKNEKFNPFLKNKDEDPCTPDSVGLASSDSSNDSQSQVTSPQLFNTFSLWNF